MCKSPENVFVERWRVGKKKFGVQVRCKFGVTPGSGASAAEGGGRQTEHVITSHNDSELSFCFAFAVRFRQIYLHFTQSYPLSSQRDFAISSYRHNRTQHENESLASNEEKRVSRRPSRARVGTLALRRAPPPLHRLRAVRRVSHPYVQIHIYTFTGRARLRALMLPACQQRQWRSSSPMVLLVVKFCVKRRQVALGLGFSFSPRSSKFVVLIHRHHLLQHGYETAPPSVIRSNSKAPA